MDRTTVEKGDGLFHGLKDFLEERVRQAVAEQITKVTRQCGQPAAHCDLGDAVLRACDLRRN